MPFDCAQKKKCPDCFGCQMCGETRCRICRKYGHMDRPSELGSGFTHAEYMAWKLKRTESRSEKGTIN